MAKEPTKSSKDKAGSAAPKDKKEASPTTTTAPAAKAAGSSKASTPDSKKAPPSSAEKGAVKKEEVAKVAKNKKEEDKKDTKKDAAKEDGGEKKNKEEEAKVNGDKSKAETAAEDEAKDTLFSEPSVPIRSVKSHCNLLNYFYSSDMLFFAKFNVGYNTFPTFIFGESRSQADLL